MMHFYKPSWCDLRVLPRLPLSLAILPPSHNKCRRRYCAFSQGREHQHRDGPGSPPRMPNAEQRREVSPAAAPSLSKVSGSHTRLGHAPLAATL